MEKNSLNSISLIFVLLLLTTVFQSCSTDGDDPGYDIEILSQDPSGGNSGGTSGGGSSGSVKYEAPEIYYYDCTSGYTTLTVSFKIGNKDRTKVTSAKAYCGSSSTNCNTGSAIIYANFSGLKKGTKYKVYCVASGPGGSGISDVVTLPTLN